MTILYIYITIFTLYYIVLACSNLKPAKKIRDKYTNKDANICVVVYATGAARTLDNLLKQLKTQNYPKQRYTIYAILDRCEKSSDVTLQSDLDINVISINNLEPIGKSQAYSSSSYRFSSVAKVVYSGIHSRLMVPMGPFLCLATMTSARFFISVSLL